MRPAKQAREAHYVLERCHVDGGRTLAEAAQEAGSRKKGLYATRDAFGVHGDNQAVYHPLTWSRAEE